MSAKDEDGISYREIRSILKQFCEKRKIVFADVCFSGGFRGGADTDRNRKITAKELFQFVSQGMEERSKDQLHPVMWGRFDDDEVLMDWN